MSSLTKFDRKGFFKNPRYDKKTLATSIKKLNVLSLVAIVLS